MPMPMFTAGSPRCRHRFLSSSSRWDMRIAVRQACSGWAVSSIGAPKKAMIASPMYLSTVPLFSKTTSVIAVRYSLRSVVSSSSGRRSAMVVNPRMSEKRIESSVAAPPSCN